MYWAFGGALAPWPKVKEQWLGCLASKKEQFGRPAVSKYWAVGKVMTHFCIEKQNNASWLSQRPNTRKTVRGKENNYKLCYPKAKWGPKGRLQKADFISVKGRPYVSQAAYQGDGLQQEVPRIRKLSVTSQAAVVERFFRGWKIGLDD